QAQPEPARGQGVVEQPARRGDRRVRVHGHGADVVRSAGGAGQDDPHVALPGRDEGGPDRLGLTQVHVRRCVSVPVVHRHRDVRRAAMETSRRKVLMSALFGAGYVGLRALATGIPASVLLKGRRALADGAPACPHKPKAQFVVLATSGSGDPINANVPGTYEDINITHSADPTMKPMSMTLGGKAVTAALPWTQLPQNVLDRTTFWHIMTNTPV